MNEVLASGDVLAIVQFCLTAYGPAIMSIITALITLVKVVNVFKQNKVLSDAQQASVNAQVQTLIAQNKVLQEQVETLTIEVNKAAAGITKVKTDVGE